MEDFGNRGSENSALCAASMWSASNLFPSVVRNFLPFACCVRTCVSVRAAVCICVCGLRVRALHTEREVAWLAVACTPQPEREQAAARFVFDNDDVDDIDVARKPRRNPNRLTCGTALFSLPPSLEPLPAFLSTLVQPPRPPAQSHARGPHNIFL